MRDVISVNDINDSLDVGINPMLQGIISKELDKWTGEPNTFETRQAIKIKLNNILYSWMRGDYDGY